jgi:hypothetical protein
MRQHRAFCQPGLVEKLKGDAHHLVREAATGVKTEK